MNIRNGVADRSGGESILSEQAPPLERLYLSHIDKAVRIAFLMTGDREKAQDIAHDAFVKISGRFHDIRHREAFPAYLRATVLNLCRSHLRRVQVQRNYLQKEAGRADTAQPSLDVEAQDELWNALKKLPHKRRAAIVLRYYEDLSEQETAEALGCSVPAVKSLVARGLKTLRDEIREER